MKDFGVIYVAANLEIYLKAAMISALAFRKLNLDIPITILCDRNLPAPTHAQNFDIQTLSMSTSKFGSRSIKTQLNKLTPYTQTLYLDADVLPIKPVPDIWDYLSNGDTAMVCDRRPTVSQCDHISQYEIDYTLQRVCGDARQYNSGVMLWRKTTDTDALFDRWNREWEVFQKLDQLALVRAIGALEFPVIDMPINYNSPPVKFAPDKCPIDGPSLLHCWGGQVVSGEFFTIAQQHHPDLDYHACLQGKP